MKINLPNRLTLIRILMIPLLAVLMLLSTKNGSIEVLRRTAPVSFLVYRYAAFLVFAAASFTDFLDGRIARKYGLITNFGKFMDPLADKLLVCTALILLMAEKSLPVWCVLIIIAREFIISGFRLVASDAGIVIAASVWGKAKTISQMVLCLVLLLPRLPLYLGNVFCTVLAVIASVLTVLSLADYVYKNRDVILRGGM